MVGDPHASDGGRLIAQGDSDGALGELEAAIQLNPTHPTPYIYSALARLSQLEGDVARRADVEQVLELIQKANALHPSSNYFFLDALVTLAWGGPNLNFSEDVLMRCLLDVLIGVILMPGDMPDEDVVAEALSQAIDAISRQVDRQDKYALPPSEGDIYFEPGPILTFGLAVDMGPEMVDEQAL